VIEARCLGCGKRYRLKGDPNAMDFLSLPCPECGGMLEMSGAEEEVIIEDFLLEKPLALVYWEEGENKNDFLKELMAQGYEVRTINRPTLLVQWLRFHTPALLVLFCGEEKLKPFIEILERLGMLERRQIFTVWISPEVKTMDPKTAFLKSIQLVINAEDLFRFGEILKRAQKMWADFYASFLELQDQVEGSLL